MAQRTPTTVKRGGGSERERERERETKGYEPLPQAPDIDNRLRALTRSTHSGCGRGGGVQSARGWGGVVEAL